MDWMNLLTTERIVRVIFFSVASCAPSIGYFTILKVIRVESMPIWVKIILALICGLIGLAQSSCFIELIKYFRKIENKE